MRKILMTSILFGVSLVANAQQRIPLPVICAEPAFVEKVIREHKEEILFAGKDTIHGVNQLSLNLFYNSKTGTYSAVLVAPDASMVCVISSGDSAKLIYNN